MRHWIAVIGGAVIGLVAFNNAGGFYAVNSSSLGVAVFGFLSAGACVESFDLFLFAASRGRSLERVMDGRYGTLVSAAGLLAFVTLLAALAVVFGPPTPLAAGSR